MNNYNPQVDDYFMDGCGRCPLGGTPQCKVHSWQDEMKLLRTILVECGLTEELKWGVPCYTYQNNNVVTLSALVNYCALGFFKGVLLQDSEKILEKPGENTQSARLIKFTNTKFIVDNESTIKAYLYEAIEVEKAGLKADFKAKTELVYPEELISKFQSYPDLQKAFEALTPGRQRGYILHFTAPKQSTTRSSRIDKCVDKIMDGKGFHDR